MAKTRIACVGGFLGAGKTTVLASAVRELMSRGLRVGVITNDQGNNLVDTAVMRELGVPAEEVGGGCFCCRFDDFLAHAGRICEQHNPHIILAEAVGSCTDLAATVYEPLRRFHADRFDLAPLSVVVEPDRLTQFFRQAESGFPTAVSYLFEKQLAEAELILLNKSDLIDPAEGDEFSRMLQEHAGPIPVHLMSARDGSGIAAWVDQLLGEPTEGGSTLDIDYELYGEAEAALAWLNATVDAVAPRPFAPNSLGETVIGQIRQNCSNANATIAHLKILVATSSGCDRIAIAADDARAEWSSDTEFTPVSEASIIINARVNTSAERLREIVEQALASSSEQTGETLTVQDIQAFLPSPPKPRYRLQAQSR